MANQIKLHLGDTVSVTNYGKTEKMWLVKDLNLKKYTKDCYVVLGWHKNAGGWYTILNSSLANARKFIRKAI